MRLRDFESESPRVLWWLQAEERVLSVLLRRGSGEDYMPIGIEWLLLIWVGAAALVRSILSRLQRLPLQEWDSWASVWVSFAVLVFLAGFVHSWQNGRLKREQRETVPTGFVGYSIFLNRAALRRASNHTQHLRVFRASYWKEFAVVSAIALGFCAAEFYAFGLYLLTVAVVLLNNGTAMLGRHRQQRLAVLNAMYLKARQVELLREIDGGRAGIGESVSVR